MVCHIHEHRKERQGPEHSFVISFCSLGCLQVKLGKKRARACVVVPNCAEKSVYAGGQKISFPELGGG